MGIDVGLGVFEAVVSLSYSCEAVTHGGSECGAIGWSGAVENEKLWGSQVVEALKQESRDFILKNSVRSGQDTSSSM